MYSTTRPPPMVRYRASGTISNVARPNSPTNIAGEMTKSVL